MNTRKYRVAVIGAGNISAGYDSPEDTHILTHAHAIKINARLDCLGFYDVNKDNARKAAEKWGFPIIFTFQEILKKKPDLVVIASPDDQHFHDILKLAGNSIRFILCEKPLTTNSKDSRVVVSLLKEKGTSLLVNYQMRYDATVNHLRDQFHQKAYGKPVAVNVIYSKGILHNGSHAIDLLQFFFGMPLGCLITGRRFDFNSSDPTLDGILFFDSFLVHLIAGDEDKFSVFEIDMIFESARFRFIHSGNEYEKYTLAIDPLFPDYRELKLNEKLNTGLRVALSAVYEDIVALIDTGREPDENLQDALNTQLICEVLNSSPLNQYQQILNKFETC